MKAATCLCLITMAVQLSSEQLQTVQRPGNGFEATTYFIGDGNDDIKLLIIDTDAGSDDGVAILNLLGAEIGTQKVKTVLISTVNGNVNSHQVGINVLKILKTVERLDIPVYKGANCSLIKTPKIESYFGKDGFGDFHFPDPPPVGLLQKEPAAYALVRAAASTPGKLSLLCLGPLTNVALAIRLDPKFLENLKEIFVLGGSDSGIGNMKPGIEFNFYMDPDSAAIVFEEAEKKQKILNLVTWETCSIRSKVEMKWRTNILGTIDTPQVDLINKAEKAHLEGDHWISADTILSAVVLDEGLIESGEKYHASVESSGNFAKGALFVDYDSLERSPSNVYIIKKINTDRYKNMLIKNFMQTKGTTSGASKTL